MIVNGNRQGLSRLFLASAMQIKPATLSQRLRKVKLAGSVAWFVRRASCREHFLQTMIQQSQMYTPGP